MNIYKTFACKRCGVLTTRDRRSIADICFPCSEEHRKEGTNASNIVNKAVRKGELQKVNSLTCVDCGSAAENYEHRDYTKPLEVEPVCRKCNLIRGHAKDSILREFITPHRNERPYREEGKTVTNTIRLPPESWRKLRALFQHHGKNNHVKTLWFQAWIDKQYDKIKDKK